MHDISFLPGKTPEEIRKTFNIKNDFTPEEEEQVWFYIFLCSKIVNKQIFKQS